MAINDKFLYLNIIEKFKTILRNKIIIIREFEAYKYKQVIKAPNITYNERLNKNIYKLRYTEQILIFIQMLEKIFPPEDLKAMYRNLNDLQIVVSNGSRNYYHQLENIIYLNKSTAPFIIFHELFHMASNKYSDEDVCFTGFHQKITYKGYDIGYGLNEGYTEYLTHKYFKNFGIFKGYRNKYLIASKLEIIIGEELMERCYINADLARIQLELEKYDTKDNVLKFITMVDLIKAYPVDYKNNASNPVIINAFNYIFDFLEKCYTKKISSLHISNMEKDRLIKDFIDNLHIIINNKRSMR